MNSHLWPEGASSTRERLLAAMLDCVAGSGYRETTVADVVRVAQTSRRSFYQEFDDKQDCFFTLLRTTNTFMISEIAAAIDHAATPEVQVRQAVSAYVRTGERYPGLTLSWIRELPALGREAKSVKDEAMEDWIRLFVSLTSTPEMVAAGVSPISRERAMFLWGGVRELTADAVESGAPLSEIIEPATAACLALIRAGGS
ncbi:TetR/AcrR family transcriptional regulator [Gordonia sp. GONU]|uniref:TetR/AcrR family transcriptional regulator n=1 Tax=Gordonia sp. GONU TaxID=2972949 RepID=UPI0021AC4E32|nr:TetR/AcrR family transcriptional regulator [Gordonia sp. GONU]MCR8897395.1 TetR/AcrR family transcriptional regulator [Gordonia sp. GONU]